MCNQCVFIPQFALTGHFLKIFPSCIAQHNVAGGLNIISVERIIHVGLTQIQHLQLKNG